jgi:hypothetical protein
MNVDSLVLFRHVASVLVLFACLSHRSHSLVAFRHSDDGRNPGNVTRLLAWSGPVKVGNHFSGCRSGTNFRNRKGEQLCQYIQWKP